MRKIVLGDLIEEKKDNETNPILLYNKQELQETKHKEPKKEGFYDLHPTTNLEKNIYSILTTEKNLQKQKARENIILAQFDSKMRRIKNIKSKTYRRIRRQEKIKTMLIESEGNQDKTQNVDDNKILTPANLLNKYINDTEKVANQNVFEFGDKQSNKDKEIETVKSVFGENNDFINNFEGQKEENIIKEAPEDIKEVLPGWGSWAGTDLEIVETKYNTFVKFKDGVECKDRKDYKENHVIINENTAKLPEKYVADVPYGYTTEDYDLKMKTPVIKNRSALNKSNKHSRGDRESKNMRYDN